MTPERKIDPKTGKGTVGDLPLARELVAYQRETRRSWRDIARDVGYSYPVITQYRDGTYRGNKAKVAEAIRAFLERAQARKDGLAVPFVATTVTKRVMEICALAHAKRTIGVVTGPAGIGKTMALREFVRRTHRAYLVTCDPATRNAKAITTETLLAMDEHRGRGTLLKNVERLRERLSRTDAILVYDEAQHLAYLSLEQLRAIHDATGVAMVFVGTETLYDSFTRRRDTVLAQLFSRIGCYRHVNGGVTREDVRRVLEAAVGKTTAAKLEAYCFARAELGGLRLVMNQLDTAVRMATFDGKDLALAHMKEAAKTVMV